MSQVIIFQNPTGQNVCVCVPTGELAIESLIGRDAPSHGMIVDDSTLPQGDDAKFFDAWRLVNNVVSVDSAAALEIATKQLNGLVYSEVQHRSAKAAAGLTNVMADADWSALIATARTNLANAKGTPAVAATATTPEVPAVLYTTMLLKAIEPVQAAISANTL